MGSAAQEMDRADVSMVEDGAGAAFQVIILGGGGGPGENDTTGLLVRSTSTEWGKGSVLAVDAGVHLSAIEEVFRQHLPGAIKVTPPPKRASRLGGSRLGSKLELPIQPEDPSKPRFYPPVSETRGASRSTSPVESHAHKQMNVMTSGPFNNLMVPYENPSSISAYFLRNLVSTVLITHPHLDHLSGFVINTAALQNTTKPKKLVGLPSTIEAIKTHIFNDVVWPNMSDEEGGIGFVSYQRLSEGGHSFLGEHEAAGYIEICDSLAVKAYLVSHGNCVKRHRHRGSGSVEPASPTDARRRSSHFGSISGNIGATGSLTHSDHGRASTWAAPNSITPMGAGWAQRCVVDSSAFFIRDDETTQEVLIFGDVEPDKVSAEPRNQTVWTEAAPKVARGSLTAIFIECSYDDSQGDSVLFGHLAPRHLVGELAMLAAKVTAFRRGILNYGEAQPKEPVDPPSGFVAVVSTVTSSVSNRQQRRGSLPAHGFAGNKKRAHESPARGRPWPNESPDVSAAASGTVTPTPLPAQAKKRATAQRPPPERSTSGVSPLSSPVAAEPPPPLFPSPLPPPSLPPSFSAAPSHPLMETTHASSLPNPETFDGNDSAAAASAGMLARGMDAIGTDVEIGQPDSHTLPLQGVKVVVIHVKDPLKDNWDPKQVILKQLREHEREWRLGCEFVMCKRGDSIWV